MSTCTLHDTPARKAANQRKRQIFLLCIRQYLVSVSTTHGRLPESALPPASERVCKNAIPTLWDLSVGSTRGKPPPTQGSLAFERSPDKSATIKKCFSEPPTRGPARESLPLPGGRQSPLPLPHAGDTRGKRTFGPGQRAAPRHLASPRCDLSTHPNSGLCGGWGPGACPPR